MTVYQSTVRAGHGILFPADVARRIITDTCSKCHGPAAMETFQQWTGGAWYEVTRVRCSGLGPLKREERMKLRRERGLPAGAPVRCDHIEERSRVPRLDLPAPVSGPKLKREEPDPMSKPTCSPKTRALAADVVDKKLSFRDAVASGADGNTLRGAMSAEVAARKRGATLRPEEPEPAPAEPVAVPEPTVKEPATPAVAYQAPLDPVRPAEFRRRMAALVASDDVAEYLSLPYCEQDTIRRLILAL